jgi:serine/threonine-protein kinase
MRSCPQCSSFCDETHRFCPSCGFPVGKAAPSPDDPLVGRTLPGGYLILELVGIGGMGRVYRAEQTTLVRTVAVKIIHPHLVGEENAAARFITEARAASRLNHPNSVGIIDFGKTPDGQLYLVMEFLRGRDLARVTHEEGALSFRRIVDVLKQTLAALAEAHSENIIHRDLKPENIILEPVRSGGDFVKVVDFGLAKMRAETQQPGITSPGIVCGTPEYMSPEQARGDPLDARSDLYSIGVLLYQLLTGRLPFEADSPTQVVLAHLTDPPRDPRLVAPERQIPASLVDVTLKALAKTPKDRFQDADEFAAELARAFQQASQASNGTASVVPGPGKSVRCASCGALNPAAQKFCGECGAPTTSTNMTTVPPRPSQAPPMPTRPMPASDRPPAGDRSRLPELPFIAREEDLAWLEARRAEARSLTGARIVGDVGIGKTRLLREFLEFASAAGDTVVQTGPDPAWAEVGCWTLRQSIVRLAGLPPLGGGARDWVAATPEARRGLSDIFGHDGPARGKGLSPEERRFAAAEALRWAMVRASERSKGHRVVLAVDDLHCVDGASRNAFADALNDPPLVPALLVGAYAPGFDPAWSPDVAAERALAGLPKNVVLDALAQSSRPSSPVFGGASAAIAPLYIEQLLRFLREDAGGGVPATLADIIAVRAERLPSDARRTLQAVAVWGDDADDRLLGKLLSDEVNFVEAVAFLRHAGMVQVTDGVIRTSHPLLREVTLATIPAAVKRELHAAAAIACDDRDLPIEVRALHEAGGGTSFQALLLLERVSVLCSGRGDHPGAVNALRRALELARRELFRGELDDPMRAVLIFSRKLGEALAKGGQFNDADGVLREALDVAGPSGVDRAAVLGALAHVAHERDRRQDAREYLREALTLASRSGSAELLASLEGLRRSFLA